MKKLPAIKTLDDIRQRCHVNDDGEWIWKSCVNRNKTPYAKTPHHGSGASLTVLRLAWCIKNKVRYEDCPHRRIWNKNGNPLDVNPDNAIVGTVGDHNKFKAPMVNEMRRKVIALKGRTTRGRKFTPEQVQYIRNSNKTEKALREEFIEQGISVSKAMIGRIRRCEDYVPLAIGASVFSLGMAA